MVDENNSKPEEQTSTPEPAPVTAPQAPESPVQHQYASHQGPANGFAIAALVVGIVAVITGWIPFWGFLVGATAVVLGIIGLKKAHGKGMAIAGIATGGVGALWGLLVTILFIVAIILSATTANGVQQAMQQENEKNLSLIDSKKNFEKGETANFANKYEVKVNSVETNYNAGEYFTPAEGKQYIVVNVTIKNISDEPEYFTPMSISLLENGLAQTNTYVTVADELNSGQLSVNASTTGNIVYEVSTNATDLKLQYDTTVFDQSYSSKKLVYTLAI